MEIFFCFFRFSRMLVGWQREQQGASTWFEVGWREKSESSPAPRLFNSQLPRLRSVQTHTVSHQGRKMCENVRWENCFYSLFFHSTFSRSLFRVLTKEKAFASPQQRKVLVRRCQMCRAAFWGAVKDVESVCKFTTQCAWPSDDFTL